MKKYKIITITLILLTTLPFLFLLKKIDFSLFGESQLIFWKTTYLAIGNTLAYIGAILLFWEFILGIRQFIAYFTKDIIWMSKVHQWIGKYGVLLIFAHPIFSMLSSEESIVWIFTPHIFSSRELHITFGRITLLLLLTIYITSALIRGKIRFRPWKYIHYLSYPLIALTFLHAHDLGSFLLEYPILNNIWYGMIIAFIILFTYRLLTAAGIGKLEYQVISKANVGENMFIIKLRPAENTSSPFSPLPGQYFYLSLKPFGETHPFSLLEFDKSSGELTFGIKIFGGFTKKLNQIKVKDAVFIEGPYGVFTKEGQNNEPKVILAGGIGITPFIELIKQYGQSNTTLINCNKTLNETLLRNELKALLKDNYYDFLSQSTMDNEGNIINGHLDHNKLMQILPKDVIDKSRYFICGSKRFIEGMIENLQKLGIPEEQIFTEKFY